MEIANIIENKSFKFRFILLNVLPYTCIGMKEIYQILTIETFIHIEFIREIQRNFWYPRIYRLPPTAEWGIIRASRLIPGIESPTRFLTHDSNRGFVLRELYNKCTRDTDRWTAICEDYQEQIDEKNDFVRNSPIVSGNLKRPVKDFRWCFDQEVYRAALQR